VPRREPASGPEPEVHTHYAERAVANFGIRKSESLEGSACEPKTRIERERLLPPPLSFANTEEIAQQIERSKATLALCRKPNTMLFDLTDKLVWVAGQHGMVGGAMMRRLQHEPCQLLADPGRRTVDFRRQSHVEEWMASHRPRVVFLTAGRVGGIHANDTFPADFLYDNLLIEANIIHAAYRTGVEKLLFFGSSCIYPRETPQPIREEALLTRPLERTNEAYAVAKIAGIKLCQAYRSQHGCDFISAMPTNLYGPGDNFHVENSHVPAALLRRFHDAKLAGAAEVVVWGSGTPRREFLYVDDLADASVHSPLFRRLARERRRRLRRHCGRVRRAREALRGVCRAHRL
jgi:GDP-L-fucose synthase